MKHIGYILSLTIVLHYSLVSCEIKRPQGVEEMSPKAVVLKDTSEGLAAAKADNGLWGYVDADGNWMVKPQYSYAADFSDGVALVSYFPDKVFQVIDSTGKQLSEISVNGIRILEHYHDGVLIYQDLKAGGYGLLDKQGNVILKADASQKDPALLKEMLTQNDISELPNIITAEISPRERMNQVMYWLYESARIAASQPADSTFREVILHYTECLRTAYEVKDIDFINQAFSDDALIIVGKMIKQQSEGGFLSANRVEYNLRTKKQYLQQLSKVFASNEQIRLSFNEQKVVRHPTKEGFYGVTLKQGYRSDTYSDEGYLFLLWDFRNPEQPQIHVRTWQPAMLDINTPLPESQVFNFSDFTLE